MSRINYSAIEDAISAQLLADATVAAGGTKVFVEEAISSVEGRQVFIYLERRDMPDNMQSLSAGKAERSLLRFSIWCYGSTLEGSRASMSRRDQLLGEVEIALMKDRTLGGTVIKSWLNGGEFRSGMADDFYMCGAEIVLIADVKATY